jgi:hypothetical protein
MQNGLKSDSGVFWANFPTFLLLLISIVFLIMIGGLYGGHIYFMMRLSKTTNEALKNSDGYNFKQFEKSVWRNGLS